MISRAFAAVAANPKIRFCERTVRPDSSEERGAIYHAESDCQQEIEERVFAENKGFLRKTGRLAGGDRDFFGGGGKGEEYVAYCEKLNNMLKIQQIS